MADAAIDQSIVRKIFVRTWLGPPLTKKVQNLSPSIQTVGPFELATSSFATVVLPAPGGPASKMIFGFINVHPSYEIIHSQNICHDEPAQGIGNPEFRRVIISRR